ncbi:MAG: hypothetical protein ACLFSM_02560 [Thermoplasmata archaeon]
MPNKIRFGENHITHTDRPSILVLGIGGAGRNIAEEIEDISSENVKIYEVDSSSRPPKLPYISVSKEDMNKSYHSNVKTDKRPLTESERRLENKIKEFDILYLIAGLGGRTGSWTAPLCAELGDKHCSFSFGFFAKPFKTESYSRKRLSDEAQDKLVRHLDGTAVFPNSRLLDINPHLPIKKAFGVMNRIIRIPLIDLNSVITASDIPHLKELCGSTEEFRIGAGYGKGRKKGKRASREALKSPWFEDEHIYKKIITIITTSDGKSKMDIEDGLEEIEDMWNEADMIWGIRKDPDLDKRIRVTILLGK